MSAGSEVDSGLGVNGTVRKSEWLAWKGMLEGT